MAPEINNENDDKNDDKSISGIRSLPVHTLHAAFYTTYEEEHGTVFDTEYVALINFCNDDCVLCFLDTFLVTRYFIGLLLVYIQKVLM